MNKFLKGFKKTYQENENIFYISLLGVLIFLGIVFANRAMELLREYWYVPIGIVYLIYFLYKLDKQYQYKKQINEELRIMDNAEFIWGEFVQKLLQAQQDVINIPNFSIDNFVIDEGVFYNKHIYDFVIRRADSSYMLDKNLKERIFTNMSLDLETLIRKYIAINPDIPMKYYGVNKVNLHSIEENGSKIRIRVLLVDCPESLHKYQSNKAFKRLELQYSNAEQDTLDEEL